MKIFQKTALIYFEFWLIVITFATQIFYMGY